MLTSNHDNKTISIQINKKQIFLKNIKETVNRYISYLYLWKNDGVPRKYIGIQNKITETNKFKEVDETGADYTE